MLLSPCLQWALYAIIPSVYKIYRPPFGRDDILHITLLLRKRAICGNIVPRAGHNIQIHSGIIAHIMTVTRRHTHFLWEISLGDFV